MIIRIGRIFAVSLSLLSVSLELRAAAIVSTPFSGVRYTHRTQKTPRSLSIHIVEIDLTDPGVRFMVTPKNVGTGTGENKRQTTRAFVDSVKAQIGTNASFYYTSTTSGSNSDNRGIIASQGHVYSPFGDPDASNTTDNNNPWPAINISADNVAQIVNRATPYRRGFEIVPDIPLYNAVSGSEQIVTNGQVTAGQVSYGQPGSLQPRTVIGYTADRKIVLMVVDGRTVASGGMYSTETAALLIQYGVVNAVNFDGGGSSTMVFADPVARTINEPSDEVDRSVATNFAVFASPATTTENIAVLADFYAGDRSTFAYAPTTSGSTQGVLTTSKNEAVQSAQAVARGWFQRLTINDDPAVAAVTENSTGGWFVRHLSGATGAPGENLSRPTQGYVGFWARTSTPGIEVAIALDAPSTADRSLLRPLTADGQWHLYEWSLEDPSQWRGWAGGDGVITSGQFTVDSIHLFGPNADAVVDLDMIAHNAYGSLNALFGGGATPLPVLADDTGTGRLINASVRNTAGAGDQTLIVGFVVAGSANSGMPVLVRAAGPALTPLGVPGALPDPRLLVLDGRGSTVATNNDWGGAPAIVAQADRLGAFAFQPNSLDAAALTTFQPGSYTAQVSGAAGSTGIALLEAYDASDRTAATAPARLVNISARAQVGTGDNILIMGFVIEGGSRRVLIRAAGPSLLPLGVTTALLDPQLSLHTSSTVYATNDNWGGSMTLRAAYERTGAFSLPFDSKDSALLLSLPPGGYTAQVRGAADSTGVALLEIYEVP